MFHRHLAAMTQLKVDQGHLGRLFDELLVKYKEDTQ